MKLDGKNVQKMTTVPKNCLNLDNENWTNWKISQKDKKIPKHHKIPTNSTVVDSENNIHRVKYRSFVTNQTKNNQPSLKKIKNNV